MINTNDSMDILIGKLDNIFQSQTTDEGYSTYSKFINYKRNDDEDISGYIIEYEHLHKQIIDFDMKLFDPVLTFKLIDGANLLDDDRKLALTIDNDMKFENMKSAFKWLLSKTKSLYDNQADRQLRIKEAETYFTKNKSKGKQYGKYSQNNKKLNPPNKIDKVSHCLICDSNMQNRSMPSQIWQCSGTSHQNETDSDHENCEEVTVVLMTRPCRYCQT